MCVCLCVCDITYIIILYYGPGAISGYIYEQKTCCDDTVVLIKIYNDADNDNKNCY